MTWANILNALSGKQLASMKANAAYKRKRQHELHPEIGSGNRNDTTKKPRPSDIYVPQEQDGDDDGA